ncbi:MAG: hypothetical protein ACRCYQ_14945, partial [Nocardioides sp.]
ADKAALAHEAIADPVTAIMSLTITEAGYAEPSAADQRTTIDTLVDGLELRRRRGADGLTILSCDNVPGNGDIARRAFAAAADRRAPGLAAWLDTECGFPHTMVDRITPQTTDADREWLLTTHGLVDAWPVVGEPFRQWVVQDRFVAGRPDWHRAGALFTDDVGSWELYKLRLLNAAHSSMAYLCALAGIVYVDEGLAAPVVREYLTRLLHEENLPTLTEIAGHPGVDYIDVVLERFANTGVRDQVARLCIDGTAKFPTFLIPAIAANVASGGPIHRGCLALAGWSAYLTEIPRAEQAFDAAGERPRRAAEAALSDPGAFVDFREVFPAVLAADPRFRATFVAARDLLARVGPIQAMARVDELAPAGGRHGRGHDQR